MPVPVSYKSNDAILCQLVREGKISIDNLNDYRKDGRKITYSKEQDVPALVEMQVLLLCRKTVRDE